MHLREYIRRGEYYSQIDISGNRGLPESSKRCKIELSWMRDDNGPSFNLELDVAFDELDAVQKWLESAAIKVAEARAAALKTKSAVYRYWTNAEEAARNEAMVAEIAAKRAAAEEAQA